MVLRLVEAVIEAQVLTEGFRLDVRVFWVWSCDNCFGPPRWLCVDAEILKVIFPFFLDPEPYQNRIQMDQDPIRINFIDTLVLGL